MTTAVPGAARGAVPAVPAVPAQVADPAVTFVSSHARLGGSEHYLERLLGELGPAWVRTVVVLEDGPLVPRLRGAGWEPVVLPTSASASSVLRSAWRLRRHVGRHRPALVHANGVKAALVAALAGVPVLWVKHDVSWDGPVARLVARRCRQVVGVSEAVLATFGPRAGGAVVPTGVRPVAVDAAVARRTVRDLAGPAPVLALVGRLHPVKGHRDLLAAAPPGARLLFVGDDDPSCPGYGPAVRAEAGERAVFTGHRDDVAVLLAGSDVVVVPSVSEGFGMVALEAMAAGTPVVAYAAGALPEVVGDCGVLVAPGDVAGLGRALDRVLRDPGLRAHLGARGQQRALGRFGADRWVASMREHYRASRSI